MRTILITGGAGFIGSTLAEKLLAEGNKVIALDNFDAFYSRQVKEDNISAALKQADYRFIETDILQVGSCEELRGRSADMLIHIAAKAGVRPSILNPSEYARVNEDGTRAVLRWASEAKVQKVIFASSSSIYGENPKLPWSEDDEVMPISPYAATKLEGERIGRDFVRHHGIPFIALRFFTVYGPRQRPDLAISKFSRLIMDGKPIPVYGDGTTKRDYTYVDDIVAGITAAMDYSKTSFEIINLANHHSVELNELIAYLEKAIGKKAIIERLPLQKGDVPFTYADISKARKLLAYSPETDIEWGIAKYVEWVKESGNGTAF